MAKSVWLLGYGLDTREVALQFPARTRGLDVLQSA